MPGYHPESDSFRERSALRFLISFLKNHDAALYDDDVFGAGERVCEDADGKMFKELFKDHIKNLRVPNGLEREGEFDGEEEAVFHKGMFDGEHVQRAMLRDVWQDSINRPKFLFWLGAMLKRADKEASKLAKDIRELRFGELRSVLELDETSADILLVALLIHDGMLDFSSVACRYRHHSSNAVAMTTVIAKCLDKPTCDIRAATMEDSKLISMGLLDDDLEYTGVVDGFLAARDDKPLASHFYAEFDGETLPWEFFGDIAAKHGDILKSLISACDGKDGHRAANILFYGVPGSGKTSLAQALAAATGRKCYMVCQMVTEKGECHTSCGSSPILRMTAVNVCDCQNDPAKSLIIVDEADEILAGGGDAFLDFFPAQSDSDNRKKGLLNNVLDRLRAPTIWICNAPARAIDASCRRRFDYSVCFEAMNDAQRAHIWENCVAKRGLGSLVTRKMARGFATEYPVNAGGIAMALDNIARLNPKRKDVPALVAKLMAPHCELMGIQAKRDTFAPASDYSLEGLSIRTPIPLPRIIDAVRTFRNDGRLAAACLKNKDMPRMNLLLSGPPGTGKTEFVKYLGAQLNARVMLRMGSDLLSKWVGETEANIAKAFHDAAATNSILFLDEADGLINERQFADHNWEVTQTNELLSQMERFGGILVCATNFADHLDSAAIRRFTFKVRFDYLDEPGKRHFFEHMFGTRLSEDEAARLARIAELAPGDFRTVRQGLFYLGDKVSNAERLQALEEESLAKRRGGSHASSMGF